MKTKKLVALVLILTCVIGCFAGCGGSETVSVDISSTEAIEENTMPITDEDITLKIWVKNNSQSYAPDYENYEVVKELEKRTGINLEFIHPVGAAKEQLNIMIASGDLPDIIVYYFQDTAAKKAAADGTYLILDEYVDKFAPNFKKKIAEKEEYQNGIKALGDNLIYMPKLNDDIAFMMYNGFFVRQDWLDKAGLEAPKTIKEWETMLRAFKNGKMGDGSTIPFATVTSGSMNTSAFTSAFGMPAVGTYCIDPETDKVTNSVLLPGYKDYLATMNKWYKEGLIDPNFFGTSGKELDSMVLNNQLGSFFYDNNSDMPKYMMANEDLSLVALPYPQDETGRAVAPLNNMANYVMAEGAVVTSSCAHPVEAVRFLDYLYSDEGSDLINWGIEGVTYEVKDGKKQFKDFVINNPEGKSVAEVLSSKYFPCNGIIGGVVQYSAMRGQEAGLAEKIKTQREASIQYGLDSDKSMLLGSLPFTEEENNQVATLKTDISTYISEMHQKFILGKESLDNFDSYIANLKKMNIDKVLEIYNKVYDRIK